jgi:hypothetical protein
MQQYDGLDLHRCFAQLGNVFASLEALARAGPFGIELSAYTTSGCGRSHCAVHEADSVLFPVGVICTDYL